MPAYIFGNVEVTDPEGYAQYRDQVPALVKQFGGRYLARGGEVETLEGDWRPTRVVILEFPSLEQARAFYHSQAYGPLKAMRIAATDSQIVLAGGVAQQPGE